MTQLNGALLEARDGTVGKVKDLYFDDQHWRVRYLVVDTGNWLTRRAVLISPFAVEAIDVGQPMVRVKLSRAQVQSSPDIDTDRPVSRQHESTLLHYYGFPYYWYGPLAWGPVVAPSELAPSLATPPPEQARETGEPDERSADSHLRSAAEVRGYRVLATDDSIGHIEDFLFDEHDWAIRHATVDTRNWLPGKQVLIEPDWIDQIDWAGRSVHVGLTRDAVRSSPEFDPATTVSSDYQRRLRQHYLRFKQTFHE